MLLTAGDGLRDHVKRCVARYGASCVRNAPKRRFVIVPVSGRYPITGAITGLPKEWARKITQDDSTWA
jgi:hypothetical protein